MAPSNRFERPRRPSRVGLHLDQTADSAKFGRYVLGTLRDVKERVTRAIHTAGLGETRRMCECGGKGIELEYRDILGRLLTEQMLRDRLQRAFAFSIEAAF